jgi:hypothetical protein
MAVNTWAGNAALAPVNRRQTTWRRGLTRAERLWALFYRSAAIKKLPCLPIAVNAYLFRAPVAVRCLHVQGPVEQALMIFILPREERP